MLNFLNNGEVENINMNETSNEPCPLDDTALL